MPVRPLTERDRGRFIAMRRQLFSDVSDEEHERDAERYLTAPTPAPGTVGAQTCLVLERADGLIGFVEVMLRSHAEGCWDLTVDRLGVACVEAWWVDPAARGSGAGRALIEGAAAWARAHGSRALASDAELDNLGSQRAHEALGFREVERVVCFRMDLDDAA